MRFPKAGAILLMCSNGNPTLVIFKPLIMFIF